MATTTATEEKLKALAIQEYTSRGLTPNSQWVGMVTRGEKTVRQLQDALATKPVLATYSATSGVNVANVYTATSAPAREIVYIKGGQVYVDGKAVNFSTTAANPELKPGSATWKAQYGTQMPVLVATAPTGPPNAAPAGTTPPPPITATAAPAAAIKLPSSIDIHIGKTGGGIEVPGASFQWGEAAIWKQHPIIAVAAVVIVALGIAWIMRRRRG